MNPFKLFWLAAFLLLPVAAGHRQAGAFAETDLAALVAAAAPGSTLEIPPGVYAGPLLIDRPLTLIGREWPVIDGGGRGTVVHIDAPDVQIEGFVIRNSGDSLDEENSGLAIEAPGALISGNRFENTLFGIYLREADGSVIRGNVIHSMDVDVPRRGDAIRVWYSDDVLIEANIVERGRDVVLWYSAGLTVRRNTVRDGRYGLHFMYCDDALVEENLLTHNSVGAFMMYSRRIYLRHNTIASNRGPSGYGVGLKDMDDAVIEGNLFLDNRVGAYLDNSPREVDSLGRFSGNVFGYNDVGVAMLPSVRHNAFSGNSFLENQEQVAIEGGGRMADNDWSVDGVGNYWSDYAGYDGDEDGRGDLAYRADRLFENLMDNRPELRLFVFSPAADAVDFAARAFPFVRPQPKLVDDFPLMAPVIPAGAPALPDTRPSRAAWPLLLLILPGLIVAAWPWLRHGGLRLVPPTAPHNLETSR